MELKQFGIDVVIIKPGAIITEWGSIASDNLLKVSGNTAYKTLAHKHVKMFETEFFCQNLTETICRLAVNEAGIRYKGD